VLLQVHYYSEALPTTTLTLCRSEHAKALQAAMTKGLAKGPYVAARVGFEPATFQTQGTKPKTEPPRPKCIQSALAHTKLNVITNEYVLKWLANRLS